MPRILLLKQSRDEYDECAEMNSIINACENTEWQTVTDEELVEYNKLVRIYNTLKYTDHRDYSIIIVEDIPLHVAKTTIFADANEFLIQRRAIEVEAAAVRLRKAEARKKNDIQKAEIALDKKRKEFEKLKKELGVS